MKIKRILSMTFALVMLLGMAAGMSQTAYAEGNTTEITPTKTSGTMTITLTIAAAHSVTVTPGEHMTKTADSGEASQSNLSGAMADVVYTANDGYYFPTDYSVATVNGISVTRDSYTQITVSGTPTADAAITLTAPTAKTKPDAPTTAAAVDCTTADNNDGKLTGVTTAMEYKKSDAADWTAGTDSDITGLAPGTYYVRVKATETTLASDNQELTIKGFISYTVTFKVVNGSWNDEALTGEQTVTLTGHEGDTLKLTADQIPAVGSKPNDTYKAGNWNVTPSADTEITGATTYIYTYTQKDAAVVTKAPEAKTLTDNGQTQALVTAGEATGGEMQYALGTKDAATEPYTTSIPTAINAGTYYVWYKVVGDATHADTQPACVTVTVSAAAAPATLTVGTTWKNGDTIDLGTGWFYYSVDNPDKRYSSSQTKIAYDAGNKAWKYSSSTNQFFTAENGTDPEPYMTVSASLPRTLYMEIPTGKDEEDAIGIKLVSGTGTQADPYKFELVFAEYTVTSGESQTYAKGSGKDLTFTVERDPDNDKAFDHYTGIQVNGGSVPADGYEAKSGSVIVTLKSAYLDTLSVGSHILKVLFTDGSVEIPFTVSKAAAADPVPAATQIPVATEAYSIPQTGDAADLALWAGTLILGAVGLAMLKKRKHN